MTNLDATDVSVHGDGHLYLDGSNASAFTIPDDTNSAPSQHNRFYFDATAGALRYGRSWGANAWAAQNIGSWSFAGGDSSTAASPASIALGDGGYVDANSYAGVAFNLASVTNSDYAFAITAGIAENSMASIAFGGFINNSEGSVIMGWGDSNYSTSITAPYHDLIYDSTFAFSAIGGGIYSSNGAVAIGYNSSVINADHAIAMGGAQVNGAAAFGQGTTTNIDGEYAVGMGAGLNVKAAFSSGFGRYNDSKRKDGTPPNSTSSSVNSADPVFEVGVGTSDTTRSNALTIYRDGDAHFDGVVRVRPGGDIPMLTQNEPSGVSF